MLYQKKYHVPEYLHEVAAFKGTVTFLLHNVVNWSLISRRPISANIAEEEAEAAAEAEATEAQIVTVHRTNEKWKWKSVDNGVFD